MADCRKSGAVTIGILLSFGLALTLALGLGGAIAGPSRAASPLVKSFASHGKSVSNISSNVVRRGGSIGELFALDDGRFVVTFRPNSRFDRLTIFRFLADGSPDPSFGRDGVVRSGFGRYVAPLGDGRLLVGGQVGRGIPGGDAAVRRLKENGSIDRGFGQNGLFRLDLGASEDVAQMVVTTNGRIVLQVHSSCTATARGCYSSSDYNRLALVSPGGKLLRKGAATDSSGDITAADDGTLRAIESHGDYGEAGASLVEIDRRLKIRKIRDLGAGDSNWVGIFAPLPGNGFFSFGASPGWGVDRVVKVSPDGTIDPSFGQDGGATCTGDPYGDRLEATSIKLDSQGRVLVSGSRKECQLFRLLPDGSFDGSFSNDGITELPQNEGFVQDWVAAPDPQGRVLLARWDYERGHLVIRRLTEAGTPDGSFGNGGVVDQSVPQKSDDVARDIVSAGRGSSVAVGNANCDGYAPEALDCRRMVLVKRNSRGRLDSDFGRAGKVTASFMSAGALARYGNGDLVVAGSGLDRAKTGWSGVPGFAVSQFKPNGSLDRSFGDDGVSYTYLPGKLDHASAFAVAIQPDGRILATGEAINKSRGVAPYLPIVRYNRDGSLDQSFGDGGVVTLNLTSLERGAAIKVLKNGRILIAGRDRFNPVVLRLKPNGSLDRSFGKRGLAKPKLEAHPRFDNFRNVTYTPERGATSLAVLRSGRMLVGASNGYGGQAGVVFKLKAGGKLARNFGKRGIRYTGGLSPQALTVDRCGNLTVSGVYRRVANTPRFFGVVRLTRRGRADRSFHRGRTLFPFGKHAASRATASTQSRGRVLVAGAKARLMTNEDFALTALRAANECSHG